MIKTLAVTAIVAGALTSATSGAMTVPGKSEGLERLATTGWADVMADEGRGVAYDKTGGKPGAFVYDIDFSSSEMAASELLMAGEFTAPHWLRGFDGKDYIMVAPHLFTDDICRAPAGALQISSNA